MLVRAKAVGYYDLVRRKPGAEFHIEHVKDFSFVWMEPVNIEDWALIRKFDDWLKTSKRRQRYKPSDFFYPDIAKGPENRERVIDLAEAFDLAQHEKRNPVDENQLELPLEEVETVEEEVEITPIAQPVKATKKKIAKKVSKKKAIKTVANRAADKEVI